MAHLRGMPLPRARIGGNEEYDWIALVQAPGPSLHIGPLERQKNPPAIFALRSICVRVLVCYQPATSPIGLLQGQIHVEQNAPQQL